MSIFLLAIETALAALLFVASVLAILGRTNRRWLYLAIGLPLVLAHMAGVGTITSVSYMLTFGRGCSMGYFPEALVLATAIVLGEGWLLLNGARQHEGKLRSAKWPWVWLVVMWLLASALQAVSVYAIDRRVQGVAAAQRQEVRTRFAELVGPMPSAADNAWPLYQQAFAMMDEVLTAASEEVRGRQVQAEEESEKRRAIAATQPVDDMDALLASLEYRGPKSASDLLDKEYIGKPELTDLLRRLEPALALVRQAAQRSGNQPATMVDVPTIFDSLTSYKGMRSAAVVLQLHAIEMARHGEFDAAMADVRTIHLLADHVDQPLPALISGLTRIGAHACAYDALVEALPYAKGPLKLPQGVPSGDGAFGAAFERDTRGEEEMIVGTFLGFGDGSLNLKAAARLPSRASFAYRLFWLESDTRAVRALMADMRDQRAGRPGNPALYCRGGIPKGSLMVSMLLPSLGRAYEKSEEIEATARQAKIAVALTEYRLEHGEYPAKLEAIVPRWLPDIPADPFDKKPMKYRLDGKDAIIYSIGGNMKDDGGEIEEPRPGRADCGLRLKQAQQIIREGVK